MAANNKSKIEILLAAKETGLTAAFAKAEAQVSMFSRSMATATAPMRALVSGALSLKSALTGLIIGAGVSTFAKSLIDAGKGLDGLRLSYQAIAGSSQGAAEEMEFVRATAEKLGLDLLPTANAYKQLAGAAMGTAMAGKQTRDIFVAVAKASTVLGLSADETSGALLAISQMISKGKVSAEELRGQLAERLPGAFQIAAKAMGMSTAELDKFMADGNLMADVFIPKFAAALEERFGKGAAVAANSFVASGNRILSQLFLLKGALGQAVTNNNFFVTAMNNVGRALQTLSSDLSSNGQKWRELAKQGALSVLDLAATTVRATNAIYQGISTLSFGVEKTIGYVYRLKAAWLDGAASGHKFRESIGLGSGESAQFAAEAAEAARKADQFTASSEKSWQSMEHGSTKLQAAAKAIEQYRNKMAEVAPTEVVGIGIDDKAATKAKEQIVKIGDTWTNAVAKANSEPIRPKIEVDQEAYNRSMNMLDQAVERQAKEAEAAQAKAARGVTVSWAEAASGFEDSWSSAISDISSRLDSLMAKAKKVTSATGATGGWQTGGLIGAYQRGGLLQAVQALATGGGVRNILSGGRLAGYGGGDRRLLLGEDGEFMIRKEAVRRYGVNLFAALNGLRLPELPHFAAVGMVGALPGGSSGEAMTVNLAFQGGASVPVTTTREQARQLLREIERMGWRASA